MKVTVPARGAKVDEIPRSARQLLTTAEDCGWITWATYAEALAETPKEKDVTSLVIRARHHDRRVVATWWNEKFTYAYVWTANQAPTKVGARAAATWVKESRR